MNKEKLELINQEKNQMPWKKILTAVALIIPIIITAIDED